MVHSTMMMVITAQTFQNKYNSIHNSIYLLLIPNNNKANEFDKQNQQRQKIINYNRIWMIMKKVRYAIPSG